MPVTAPPAPTRVVEAGRLLAGRYRLEELVASGGMAQVWQGTDEVLRRKVAVKLLHPHLAADGSFVVRFRKEAVAAARLAHPGIVSIYDTCSEDGIEAIVMELVASGGMAQVWQGTDEVLRRKVAVKLLHPHLAADGSFVVRFRKEAVAAARLAHPGIVSIYDTCSEDGTEAIVMELVPGQTLRERLDDPAPIDPWQAAGLAAQVAEALEAAHRAGLVHRDIKPANVLLAGDGRVKVADFGIAKAVEEADLTQPGLMVGTAKYVAPEQVEGKPVDPRTDIYSLGVVLYEMLCGRPPFVADTDAATALARLQRDALRPRQVRASATPASLSPSKGGRPQSIS